MATITGISSDVLNSVLFPDALKPDIAVPLIESRGDQGGKMFDMMLAMNAKAPAPQDVFSTFTADKIRKNIHVNANVASPGVNLPQTFALQAADIVGTASYVRVGDVILYPNSTVTSVVTTIALPNITVAPLVTTDAIPAVTAGETLIIITHQSGVGGKTPPGLVRQYEKDTFQCTIWDEAVQAAGGSQQLWWDSTTLGEDAKTILRLGYWEASIRMAGHMSGIGIWGQKSDSAIVDPNSAANNVNGVYQTSEGLKNYILRKGHSDTYNAGFLSLLDFYAVDETLAQEFVGNDIMVWIGLTASHEKDLVLGNFLKNTNVQYATERIAQAYFHKNAQLVTAFGFNAIKFTERNYFFCEMPIFFHPEFGGAEGYDEGGTMMFIPTSKAETYGGYIPRIRYRYRDYDGNNRFMEIWDTSGSGGKTVQYVTDNDVNKHNLRANGGWEFTGGNQMFLLETN